MSETIRSPRQQRAIDTKKRIIEAGYALFARDGYYNTNTAEIAKEAGVSTGIVYGYFHDKRDIMIEVLHIYTESIFLPIEKMLGELTLPLDCDLIFSHVLDAVVSSHKKNASIHEALHALTHTDKEVSAHFLRIEDEMTQAVASRLGELDVQKDNLSERVHLGIRIIEDYAHERVFDRHDYIDYEAMKSLVIRTLKGLLGK